MRPLLAAVLVFLSATARADEPSFEALGQAPIVGGDRVRARERALDEAFRQAVEQAVATILSPQAIADRTSQLKLSVYPKARGYVTTYRILEEGEQGPLFQVRALAQVATGRLARDVEAPQAVKPERAPKGKALVCVVEQRDGGPWIASPLERGVADAVAAREVEVTALAGRCAPAVRRTAATGDELDDEQAGALAKSAGVQAAVVGAVQLRSMAAIRGTALPVAHAHARLHLVGPDGRPTGVAEAEGEAWAATLDGAASAARRIAVEGAARSLGPRLAEQWPSRAAATAGVMIHVAGAERYGALQSLARALQTVPGVGTVSPRRLDGAGVDLLVQTAASARALGEALSRAPESGDGLRFAAEPLGDLELKVRVVAPPPPPTVPPPAVAPGAPPSSAPPPG